MADESIDKREVLRMAALCRLELRDAEAEQLTTELAAVLAHVRQLEQVAVEGVAPTAHVQLDRLATRPDVPRPSLERARVLREAPGAGPEGFEVPAFVDEG